MSISPTLNAKVLFSCSGLSALLLAAPSHGAITDLSLAPNVNAIGQYVANVTFDRDVCRGPARNRVQADLQPPIDAVVQTRLDGSTLSVALDVRVGTVGCPTTRTWQIALPELKAGSYSVRVAEANDTMTSSFYVNRTIGSAMVASLNVVAPDPAPVPLYLLQTGYLVPVDAGSYQYGNFFASNLNRWQPAFHGWVYTGNDVPARNLVELVALTYTGPDGVSRPYYTIDPAERGYLLATGYFSQSSDTARYYVIAPMGGGCAEGRTAIYRAFDSVLVRHRYVPAATYRTLIGNGWKGEGLAFCAGQAPAADDWTPN